MTGIERMEAAIAMRPGDRVPVSPLAHYYTAAFAGRTIREFASDPEVMAASFMAAVDRFGWDFINVGCDVAVEASGLGAAMIYEENAPPHVAGPILADPAALDRLRVPNPLRDGRMPVVVKAAEICAREIGGDVLIGAFTMDPMNLSSQLRGVQNLMLDTYDRPDFVEDLLDFSTVVVIEFGKALIDAGAKVILFGAALCSPNMISPVFYRTKIAPRQRRQVEALRAHGAEHVLMHICGNVTPIIPDIAALGCDMIDLDWQVDVPAAKRTLAGAAAVRGNLDPGFLLNAGPDAVYDRCCALIRATGPGGFILGSGCDVMPGTPAETMDAMVQAARDCAAS